MMHMLSVGGRRFNDGRHKLYAGPLWAATTRAAKTRT